MLGSAKQAKKGFHSHYVVGAGFAVVLLLLATAGAFTINQLQVNRQVTTRLITEATEKSRLVNELRHIARERAMLLFTMTKTADVFKLDEQRQQFDAGFSNFIRARTEYEKLPASAEEKQLFQRALFYIRTASGVAQDAVLQQIDLGNIKQATSILFEQAIPAQNKVMQTYTELMQLQDKETQTAIQEVNSRSGRAQTLITLIGLLTVAISFMVALLVVRRTRTMENSLQAEKELAEVTLFSIADGIITTDAQCRIAYINPIAARMLNMKPEESEGKHLADVLQLIETGSQVPIDVRAATNAGDCARLTSDQLTLLGHHGDTFSIRMTASPIMNPAKEIMGAVLAFQDMTESHSLQQRLAWQATHDSLTRLANRYGFETDLEALIESATRRNAEHVLMVMDLDQFKVVNDTCGHIAGDQLLVQMAMLIGQKVRKGDIIARLGGDEFGILLANCDLNAGERVAEAIRAAIAEFRFIWDDKVFTVGTSIGVVPITYHTGTASLAVSAADTACYIAKEQGRNRVHVLRGDTEIAKKHSEMLWVTRIRQAIEENRLKLYCQQIVPLIPVKNEAHYEILLRMLDEDGNIVMPGVFMPPAERYNVMPAIDKWVISNLFKLIQQTDLQGQHAFYAINLSGQSLMDESLLDFVLAEIRLKNIDPTCLCFEVTETVAISQMAMAQRFINALRTQGCKFSLDDFGSGMSSYSYLKSLHVDYLKIDGSLVLDIAHDPVDYTMVESIHRIGHAMGIKTIAEFVENEATLASLRTIGVDYAQGYLLHRPVPMDEIFKS